MNPRDIAGGRRIERRISQKQTRQAATRGVGVRGWGWVGVTDLGEVSDVVKLEEDDHRVLPLAVVLPANPLVTFHPHLLRVQPGVKCQQ